MGRLWADAGDYRLPFASMYCRKRFENADRFVNVLSSLLVEHRYCPHGTTTAVSDLQREAQKCEPPLPHDLL